MRHYPPDDEARPDELGDQWGQGGADSGGQAGDTQGLSQATNASEGAAYSLQHFHDTFITLGPLPFPLIRKAMLGDGGTLF
jgi:hypothetical protein